MDLGSIPYIGESLSLLTAVFWALAVILFKKSGETAHPLGLNLFKSSLALVLLTITALALGIELLPDYPSKIYLTALLSGFVGIGVADTLFFYGLNILGAGRMAIIEASYAPYVILFSYLWLDERLTVGQVVGSLFIVGAVVVASYTTTRKGGPPVPRANILKGIILALVANALIAISLVLIKPILDDLSLLWATIWRLIGGITATWLMILFYPKRKAVFQSLLVGRGYIYMIGATFLGQYISLLAWLGGMKYTMASVASALNETTTIFAFIFAAILLHEPVTKRRLMAMGLAVIGVAFVIFT